MEPIVPLAGKNPPRPRPGDLLSRIMTTARPGSIPVGLPVRDTTVDLLVVGSGTGMAAALAAAERGLKVLIAEKSAYVGGSTARSGGALWLPASPILDENGAGDTTRRRGSIWIRSWQAPHPDSGHGIPRIFRGDGGDVAAHHAVAVHVGTGLLRLPPGGPGGPPPAADMRVQTVQHVGARSYRSATAPRSDDGLDPHADHGCGLSVDELGGPGTPQGLPLSSSGLARGSVACCSAATTPPAVRRWPPDCSPEYCAPASLSGRTPRWRA